jgi:pimeloyl-ACP methyl ester carboxylesterase
MNLARQLIEDSSGIASKTALMVHGILGSKRNWLGFARRMVKAHPHWRVVIADLRNHGDSDGFPGPHTLQACAEDLAQLVAELGDEPQMVVGHSFGGKVVLEYARSFASDLKTLWVLDSPPGRARPNTGTDAVKRVIEKLRQIPLPISGREELTAQMLDLGFSQDVAGWMTTNLRPVDGGFAWRFELAGVEEMLRYYAEEDLWTVLEAPPSGLSLRVLRGEKSDRWHDDDVERLNVLAEKGILDHHVLAGAGHWVHTDQPERLLAVLEPDLRQPK